MERHLSQPLELFYCYARKDRDLRDELATHLAGLRRSGLIRAWYDGEISPGISWEQEIDTRLHNSRIILLLISPDFLDSDYCYSKEMAHAIERHHTGEARVIPVFLRPVVWINTPFSKLQGLPSNARPVTSWPNRDEAFEDIAKGIHRVVDDLLLQDLASLNPPTPAISVEQLPQRLLQEQQQEARPVTNRGRREISSSSSLASTPVTPPPSTTGTKLSSIPSIEVWSFQKYQFIASVTGAIFLCIVYPVSVGLAVSFPLPDVVKLGLMSLKWVIPLSFGCVYGPWVGLCTGSGSFIGGYILSITDGPPSDLRWEFSVSATLLGFVAGFILYITKGRYDRPRNIVFACILGLLGFACVAVLYLALVDWHINNHFSLMSLITDIPINSSAIISISIFIVIFLSIWLIIYKDIIKRWG